ncbi:hypothetical protein AR1Y2_0859 [Anaerostipes rhamnosivorans]|uniref:Uncharacterized protein n=1 Tax=Anaerostipes rhamnosivorans TaxID=1229621 RepID=A0A4P8IES5_9FIRM|nr:hypothetical protein AR1Y2_0859 [Anaerostipes rhamnosivorans]
MPAGLFCSIGRFAELSYGTKKRRPCMVSSITDPLCFFIGI